MSYGGVRAKNYLPWVKWISLLYDTDIFFEFCFNHSQVIGLRVSPSNLTIVKMLRYCFTWVDSTLSGVWWASRYVTLHRGMNDGLRWYNSCRRGSRRVSGQRERWFIRDIRIGTGGRCRMIMRRFSSLQGLIGLDWIIGIWTKLRWSSGLITFYVIRFSCASPTAHCACWRVEDHRDCTWRVL